MSVVVTGAGSGIGHAVSRLLGSAGIFVLGVDKVKCEDLPDGQQIQADLASDAGVKEVIAWARLHAPINGLVNAVLTDMGVSP